ncbi:MAG: hypothetical protein IJ180_08165 [Bacteroidales bacterium]|nr:hypothetical protein [Bacteroidales bacterium]
MSDKEQKELNDKIIYGLELADKRMLIEKAIHNQDVIMSKNDVIYTEKAIDLLKRLYPAIAEILITQGYNPNLYKM